MPLKRQTQLLGEADWMAGRRVAGIVDSYQSSVVSPMVKRFKKARSLEGLLRSLGPGCLRDMDAGTLETALAETEVQAAMIGRASALPRARMKDECGN